MTKEDAIDLLKMDIHNAKVSQHKWEHYDMAIKALEQEPCEECISRQAVLDVIERERFKGDAISEIEKLPSVTPKQKTGHWELTDDGQSYCCPCCKNHWISASEYLDVWKYCLNCGAKMVEPQESEDRK